MPDTPPVRIADVYSRTIFMRGQTCASRRAGKQSMTHQTSLWKTSPLPPSKGEQLRQYSPFEGGFKGDVSTVLQSELALLVIESLRFIESVVLKCIK